MITFDEIIDAVEIKNEKNAICETKSFYILLAFLLVAITLLIAVGIYCYLKDIYIQITSQITNQKGFLLIIYYKKMESNDELKAIETKIIRVIISMI